MANKPEKVCREKSTLSLTPDRRALIYTYLDQLLPDEIGGTNDEGLYEALMDLQVQL